MCCLRRETLDPQALEGADAVIHLAGANLAARRWTAQYKQEILQSRVQGTRRLVNALEGLKRPPRVLICASATGFYGNRPMTEPCDESAPSGNGFLAQVCQAWEAEALKASASGIRTVTLRFGAVLSQDGGMLAKVLPVFRLGLGGTLGNGHQPLSWVSIFEIPHIVEHVLACESLAGPLNCCSPHPVSNKEFTAALGAVLRRPAVVPVPAFVLRLILGEMADEVLLKGAAAVPAALLTCGYKFRCPDLESTLREALNPKNKF